MADEVKAVAPRGPSRAERAAATRNRILRTAYSLFAAHGYPAVTMPAIAAEAGVAVQTLYFTFGTKAQLLQHTYEYAVLGDAQGPDGNVPPTQQPWYRHMTASQDLTDALTLLVSNVGAVFARTAPLDEFVRAASFEPQAARVRQSMENRRRQAWRDMVGSLDARFPLRDGLTAERATDILMVVMSPSTYQDFVGLYDWTPAEWQTWCAHALATQLFGPQRTGNEDD
jgi:AcrR family transcriptional regulator